MTEIVHADALPLASLPRPAEDLPADPAALQELERSLRAYLAKPPFWLLFDAALERCFEQSARGARVRRIGRGLDGAALVCLALALLELVLVPHNWVGTLMVRGTMVALLLAVSKVLLPLHGGSFRREWIVGTLLAVLAILQVGWACWQGPAMKPVHEGTLLLLLPLCNQMARLRYRVALPFTVLWLLLYVAQEILLVGATPTSLLPGAVLAALLASMSLIGKRAMEVDNRATHVLKRLNAISEYRLAQANISKTRFLAAASHDLRQPVHALSLFINALKTEALPNSAAALVGNMERSVDALNQLLVALLDISKLDANVIDVQLTEFSVQPMLELLRDEYAPQAQAKGLSFELRGDPQLALRSDRTLLENVLRNLLANAIRYTASGGIALEAKRDGKNVCISVHDTGIGIPQAEQAEIFREFVQLDNAERDRAKGLGLGLAIVERTVRLLGHRLELRSSEGEGSCFTVRAPWSSFASEPQVQESFVHVDLAGMRVLVIDDDAEARAGMQALLSRWGIETIVAGSADEAIALCGAQPHVMIADFRLRESHTGAEAIARVREHLGTEIPALIVTGDTDPQRLQEAKASGHTLLHKPAHPAKISAYLRKQWREAAA